MNIGLEKSRKFAIRIYNLYKHLCDTKKEYTLAKQLLRSGNIETADFNYKNNQNQ